MGQALVENVPGSRVTCVVPNFIRNHGPRIGHLHPLTRVIMVVPDLPGVVHVAGSGIIGASPLHVPAGALEAHEFHDCHHAILIGCVNVH